MDEKLLFIIERTKRLNEFRRICAIEGMKSAFRFVFDLLPTLLHFNHPKLPGFLPDSPFGVYQYLFSDNTFLSYFNLQAEELVHSNEKTSILGIYSIGSTGSLGQSIDSDLDIWICINENLSIEEQSLLQKKCNIIEHWATSLNVDINLFVIHEKHFSPKKHSELCVKDENCGSTQHMLLLEEFYRSSICLAGKPILWYILPNFEESQFQVDFDYDDFIHEFCKKNKLNRSDWIDFGPLISLSPSEYFGASLWQLYKSIKSPFKSVLKSLLLEFYTFFYPQKRFIANQVKEFLQSDLPIHWRYFDHYYLLLENISNYLTSIHDFHRLELVRCCFYLKCKEKLTQKVEKTNWRKRAIFELVSTWKWKTDFLFNLDNRSLWTIYEVKKYHENLVIAMMKSYRALTVFAQRFNLNASISPRDLVILTRKLHAIYYRDYSSKVSLLNEQILFDLEEENLTFVYVKEETINRSGWYLYNRAPNVNSIISHQFIKHHLHFIHLFIWCYCNRLLTQKTQLHIFKSQNYSLKFGQRLINLFKDLTQRFPAKGHFVTEKDLLNVSEIRNIVLIVNLYESIDFDGNSTKNVNVFNFGKQKKSLIKSLDLVYRTSWNEVKTFHFSGKNCIIEAMKEIFSTAQKANEKKLLNLDYILCYDPHFSDLIKTQLNELIRQCILLHSICRKKRLTKFKLFRLNGEVWGIVFNRFRVNFKLLNRQNRLSDEILTQKLQFYKPKLNDKIPQIIDNVASEGVIQFFFENTDSGFNLYILDESNQVEIYRDCDGKKQQIVNNINQYYAHLIEHNAMRSAHGVFNFPQFFQIVNGKKQKLIRLYFPKSVVIA